MVYVDRPELRQAIDGVDLADIAITSDIALSDEAAPAEAFTEEGVAGVAVVVGSAAGDKCERCWKVLPEVGSHPDVPGTCDRCADAVRHLGAART